MDQNSSAVISEVIFKLQGLLGSFTGKSTSEPVATSIPDFDSNLNLCLDKAKKVAPELLTLTSIYKEATDVMKMILGYSKVCKKFSQDQEEQLKQKIMDISKKIDEVEKKNHQFSEHCRTFREIMQTAFWVFVPAPEFLFKGAVESADFWALKFMKKKNLEHNQWYKLFQNSVKSLENFVLTGYATGITFNFHGEDKWSTILSGQKSLPQVHEIPKETAKHEEPKAVPVKKTKKKQMVGQTCTLSFYENDQIVLKTDEIKMQHGIFLENSKSVLVKIEGKFKSIVISKCEEVTLDIKSCISGIEVINSKGVKIFIRERIPSFSADKCESVSLILNEENLECDIISSKTSELSVSYRKGDGNESKAHPVSSQLLTKWDPVSKQFKTTVYDQFL